MPGIVPVEHQKNVEFGKNLQRELGRVTTMVSLRGTMLSQTEVKHCVDILTSFRTYGLPLGTMPLVKKVIEIQDLIYRVEMYSEIVRIYEQTLQFQSILTIYDRLVELRHAIDPQIAPIFMRACRKTKNPSKALVVLNHLSHSPSREILNEAILSSSTVSQAESFYNSIADPDIDTFTNIMLIYCRAGQSDDMWQIFSALPSAPVETYQALIQECSALSNLQDAETLMGLVETHALDISTYNSMIEAYARDGQFEKALSCFENMKEKKVSPNNNTMIKLFEACSKAKQPSPSALLLNASYLTTSITIGVATSPLWQSIGTSYGFEKGWPVIAGSTLTTAILFSLTRSSSNVTERFTNMFSQTSSHFSASRAVYLWQEMERLQLEPSADTKTEFVRACVNHGRTDLAHQALFNEQSIHKVPFNAAHLLLEAMYDGKTREVAKKTFQTIWGDELYRVKNGTRMYDLRKFSPALCSLAIENELQMFLVDRESTCRYPPLKFQLSCTQNRLKQTLSHVYPAALELLSHHQTRIHRQVITINPGALETWIRSTP